MGLSAEERTRLESNVERRSPAPARWVLLAMLVGFGALAAIFAARGGTSELSRPWNVVLPLLPFAFLLALATPLLIRVRRRTATPLVEGADAETRRAVTQAIRAGSAPDPRIDDLVADLRAQGTARQLGLTATIQLVGALGVGAAAVVGDEPMVRALLALATVAMLTAAGLLFQRRRQLLAYRPAADQATGPTDAGPDGPAGPPPARDAGPDRATSPTSAAPNNPPAPPPARPAGPDQATSPTPAAPNNPPAPPPARPAGPNQATSPTSTAPNNPPAPPPARPAGPAPDGPPAAVKGD